MKHQNKTKNLNKAVLSLCLAFGFCGLINAQDKITFKNGDEISAKVLEVNITQIKYKQADNLTGPTHTVYKSDVFLIKYENGSKDVFGTEPTNTPVQNIIYTEPVVDLRFDPDTSDFAHVKRKNYSGPRIGLTYISAGTSSDYLAANGKQPLVTQFGWQFEGRLFTVEGNTQGVIEFVPMIGGVEQGMFIPSASLLIGLRGGQKRSFEFAMGPNFSVIPNYLGKHEGAVGVVIAAGTNFKSGNINFPVNLAFVPSVGSTHNIYDVNTGTSTTQKFQTGFRLSLVVGFNSRKK